MTKTKMIRNMVIVVISLMLVSCAKPATPQAEVVAEPTNPQEVLEKVASTYHSMQTYKSQGTVTSDIDTGTIKMTIDTEFSILLKKPNLYLISWTQKNMPTSGLSQSGTVWNDGTNPYLFMGIMNSYSKMASDEMALGGATGISSGAANTIPFLFFSQSKNRPNILAGLINPKMEASEKIADEECYVISGSSPVSKLEKFWISKNGHLIKRIYRSLERPDGSPQSLELTDEQLEETIKAAGQEPTEGSKAQLKEMMKNAMAAVNTEQLKGSFDEVHAVISNPDIATGDFQFKPPEGSVLKQSLFEDPR